MNNPIDTMLHEHDVISQAADIVETLNGAWEDDADGYAEKATKLIAFFREYADDYHHRKEEDVLFPALKDHPDFVLEEMVDEFEQHHEDFREYAADAESALADGDHAASYKHLKAYVSDLLDHIAAENDEIFVLAENLLSENDLETIYFRFEDIDRDLGYDRKAELERQVKEM
ncbi:MAG: hemerythrin domain-containing protein [Flavobacteriales bacterium]|jgi:hemerythrin-like domain-containing protein|nr:hemerythrin domain-containing protein [Flavobacteriales bacterium]